MGQALFTPSEAMIDHLEISPKAFGLCKVLGAEMCHCRGRDVGSMSPTEELTLVTPWLVTPCLLCVAGMQTKDRTETNCQVHEPGPLA